mgnify:CR=1 FL=1
MNWFNVLKNAGLAQSQRQGFRLDDKDEDYVLEDDSTCRDKLIKLYQKALNSFPDGKRTDKDKDIKGYDLRINHKFEYDEGVVEVRILLPHEGVLPDDVYCRLLKEFERVEKAGPNNGGSVGYEYIDYNLKEPKLVVGDSEMYYANTERWGTSELGFYTYINEEPDLHPGQTVEFIVYFRSKEKTIEDGDGAYTGSPILRHKTLEDFKNWRGLF